MSSDVSTQIHDFISSRYPKAEMSYDDDIFSLGFVNSLFAMELVMFIEQNFAIKISSENLRIDNFRTVKSMTALVESEVVTAGRE